MESKHSNAHSSASPWQSGALTVAGLPMLQPRGLPWESCGARPPWESWGQRDPSESTSAVSADPVALFVKGNGCSWPERRPDLLVPPHKAHTVDMQSHSGSQGQAIQEAKGRGEERPRHLLTACFSIPVSSSCAELRGQRSPWNPSVIGTALHFPHLGGLVWAAAAIVSRGANPLRRGPRTGGRRGVSPDSPRDPHGEPLAPAPCGERTDGLLPARGQGRALQSTTDSQQPARSPGCRQPRCAVPLELSLGYHPCRARCRLLRSAG